MYKYIYIFVFLAYANKYVCNRFFHVFVQVTNFILFWFCHSFLFLFLFLQLANNGYNGFTRASEIVEKQKMQAESIPQRHLGRMSFLPTFERETAI